MSNPRLPDRDEETWKGGFVLGSPQPVLDVSGAGGMVIAGGDALLMLRPGAENWKQGTPPDDLGPVVAVAAEQRPSWRYAVASFGGITLFGLPRDQKLTLRAEQTETQVTHLAWASFGKESVLYLRWTDGTVGRVRLDQGTIEYLTVEPMDAIASDVTGSLAMVSLSGPEPHALFSSDGLRFEERPAVALPASDPEARVHLAVAGAAIAYAIDGAGARLSRGIDEDFVPCEGLGNGGPLAFQGATPDAAVFCATRTRAMTAIHRVDAKGAVQRIAEIGAEAGEAPRLTGLLWDRSRHVLWSVGPVVGLMKSEEPKDKGGKKRVVN